MSKKIQNLKPDTVLKNYWRNNEQFADLFNAILFDGEPVIKPEELEDVDTEESSVLEHKEYAESIQVSRDNIKIRKKSTVHGVEYVLLGNEAEQHIHYAMPMRVMGYDYGTYKKQYDSNSKKYSTSDGIEEDEYLSRMKKSESKKKAIQYGEEHQVDKSVVMTVAGATNSKIDYNAFEKGEVTMCTLFNEIAKESETKGEVRGRAKEIVETGYEFDFSESDILIRLQKKLDISLKQAQEYLNLYKKQKDSIFVDLFYEDETAKKNLLSLYNALHDTDYEDETVVRKVKIDDVLYKNFKNDISFEVHGPVLVFGEHQSTVNKNMCLRCLMYVGRAYEQLVESKARYRTTLVKIPTPEFYTFYNGKKEQPLEQELALSDAFMNPAGENSVELRVKVININSDKAHRILKKCGILKEYSQFISTVRKYSNEERAIKKAIRECIDRGILADYLKRKGSCNAALYRRHKEHFIFTVPALLTVFFNRCTHFVSRFTADCRQACSYPQT